MVTQHSFYLYSFHLLFGGNWQSVYLLFLTKFITQHTNRISVKLRKYLSHERTCKYFSQRSTTLPLASPLLFTSYLTCPFPSDPLRTACLCPSPPGLLSTMLLTNKANKSKRLPWAFSRPLKEHGKAERPQPDHVLPKGRWNSQVK